MATPRKITRAAAAKEPRATTRPKMPAGAASKVSKQIEGGNARLTIQPIGQMKPIPTKAIEGSPDRAKMKQAARDKELAGIEARARAKGLRPTKAAILATAKRNQQRKNRARNQRKSGA